jgi:hypothetical protein
LELDFQQLFHGNTGLQQKLISLSPVDLFSVPCAHLTSMITFPLPFQTQTHVLRLHNEEEYWYKICALLRKQFQSRTPGGPWVGNKWVYIMVSGMESLWETLSIYGKSLLSLRWLIPEVAQPQMPPSKRIRNVLCVFLCVPSHN